MSFLARLLVAWGLSAVGLWVANALFGGVDIHGWKAYFFGSLVLGIANGIIKPILAILTLPLIILTLGFFLLLINIGMLALTAWIVSDFAIHGFWTYVGTVFVLWVVNWIGSLIVDSAARGAER